MLFLFLHTFDIVNQNLLFAFYFRCNAKFLWKRIPNNIVSSNPEITAIWAVGQKLWKKDLPGTYIALSAFNWSEHVSNIIAELRGQFYTFIIFQKDFLIVIFVKKLFFILNYPLDFILNLPILKTKEIIIAQIETNGGHY